MYKHLLLILLSSIILVIPVLVKADVWDDYSWEDDWVEESQGNTVIIDTSLKVEANTGNNSNSDSNINNGQSKTDIKIKTEINGNPVEDIEISEESQGESNNIKVESSVLSSGNKASVETKIESNGEQKQTKQEKIIPQQPALTSTITEKQKDTLQIETQNAKPETITLEPEPEVQEAIPSIIVNEQNDSAEEINEKVDDNVETRHASPQDEDSKDPINEQNILTLFLLNFVNSLKAGWQLLTQAFV